MKVRLILIVLIAGLATSLQAQQTYIHAGYLFDGTGEEMRSNVTIIVDGDRIVEVQDGFLRPDSESSLIDLSNRTVLPGLIDLHVHLENETGPSRYLDRFTKNPEDVAFESSLYAKRTLMAGFTTVRDLGGSGVNTSLRDAIRAGYVEGPRVISVGKSLATTGGHADPTNSFKRDLMGSPGPELGVVNGEVEAREAVRQNYKLGVDHIKITATGGVLSVAKSGQNPQFMNDELQAIVETARDYEMHVAAHAHGKEGMLRAVKAGVHTIEHGTYMDEEVIQAMVDHGTYYVPTITAGKFVAEKAEVDGYYPPLVVPKAREIGPLIQNTFAEAYRYGVKIAFGTDAGVFHHGDNAQEFGYMVEVGMPEAEALLSATQTASAVLGLEDQIGSVEAGKLADIIAVDGNPLRDISTLENVRFVMKEGVVYKHD
ncbi:metal-dependent hydrolase family protein [Rhodohalobacter halophilus]|uniref:metal-dependent hydrolase family protein n=1 Tax=Rhodohalobacter halophilus TaxID=1812810 RepID=UPI00083F6DCE|nr:amidohydrolase family protein [Rhodohalobacter halophilus]